MLRRLSLGYLCLPLALFALGWLRPLYGLTVTGLLLVALRTALRDETRTRSPEPLDRGDRRRFLLGVALLALAWMMVSGVGGFGPQRFDWIKHNAILEALIDRPWPVHFEASPAAEGAETALVYYLAFYLPAALVGKVLGWPAANLALFGWAWAGLVLVLLWFARLVGPRRIAVVALFALASGLDVVGMSWEHGHLELSPRFVERWGMPLRFASNVSLWLWVPQHAIGGWLPMALLLAEIRAARSSSTVGLIGAASAFWSPLAAIGLVPFAALQLRLTRLRGALGFGNLVAAPAVLIVLALYYRSLLFPLPWSFVPLDVLIGRWPLFFTVEAGIYLALCAARPGLRQGPGRPLLAVAAGSLAVIPVFRLGLYNDFVMRTSIPALFVLWTFVARAVMERADRGRAWARWALIAAFALGCVTSVGITGRALLRYRIGIPRERAVRMVVDLRPVAVARQYLGDPGSFFFRHLARAPADPGPRRRDPGR